MLSERAMPSSLASPSQDMVKELSGRLSEPHEISQQRSMALDLFNKLPLEKSPLYSKYVDMIAGLKLDSISLGFPTRDESLPGEISHLVKGREEPTLALQVDSQMVRAEVHGTLEKEGIILTDIQSALSEYPDLARPHFSKAVPLDDDKFGALNGAFYTAGTFLYVPKGLAIKIPFRNIVLLRSRGTSSFSHNIIVAEENSKVTFQQEAYSKLNPDRHGPALYSEVTGLSRRECGSELCECPELRGRRPLPG